MLKTEKISQTVNVKVEEEDRYPDVGCITIRKCEKSKTMELNPKAMQLLDINRNSTSEIRVAVVRNYGDYNIIVGVTEEQKLYKTELDGTYSTAKLNLGTGSFRNDTMYNALVEHFNLSNCEEQDYDLFLGEKVDEQVYTITKVAPAVFVENEDQPLMEDDNNVDPSEEENEEISVELNTGEKREISLQ